VRELCAVAGRWCLPLVAAVAVTVAVSLGRDAFARLPPGVRLVTARTVEGMAPYPGQARCLDLGFWPECFRRPDVKGGQRPFPEETRSALDIEGKHVTIQGPSPDLTPVWAFAPPSGPSSPGRRSGCIREWDLGCPQAGPRRAAACQPEKRKVVIRRRSSEKSPSLTWGNRSLLNTSNAAWLHVPSFGRRRPSLAS
jgi:hypothetical protein